MKSLIVSTVAIATAAFFFGPSPEAFAKEGYAYTAAITRFESKFAALSWAEKAQMLMNTAGHFSSRDCSGDTCAHTLTARFANMPLQVQLREYDSGVRMYCVADLDNDFKACRNTRTGTIQKYLLSSDRAKWIPLD